MDAHWVGYDVILLVHVIAPILIGLPVLIWGDPGGKRSERRAREQAAADTPTGKQLAPLCCPTCNAPVPLASAEFPCPSCNATVQPPEEYVRTLELRGRAVAELRRAERRWRWSRWSSSLIVTWVIRLVFVGWFLSVGAAVVMIDWGGMLRVFAMIYAVFELVGGWYGASIYAAARATMPPLPAQHFLRAPPAAASCARCGAPIVFAADAFSAVCPYCGGDNYREWLAKAARRDASANAAAARRSLLDASRELDARVDGLKLFVMFMFIAAVFYDGIYVIGAITGC